MQDFDFIETPENVELQRKLAGIGTRFIAGLLDNLILFVIFLILGILGLFAGLAGLEFGGDVAGVVIGFLIVVMFVVYWGYFVFFEMVTNGQSPGKKSQRIRVVKDGGGAITFTDIAIRNLLRAVDILGGYAVAGICMFITRKSQRLGDLAAGTVVILEAVSDYSARAGRKKHVQWEEEATAEVLRATQLTPEEYRALRNYWQRRNELSLPARRRLLQKLVLPILKRSGQLQGGESVPQLEHALAALMRTVADAKAGEGPGPAGGVQ